MVLRNQRSSRADLQKVDFRDTNLKSTGFAIQHATRIGSIFGRLQHKFFGAPIYFELKHQKIFVELTNAAS